MKKKYMMGLLFVFLLIITSACGNTDAAKSEKDNGNDENSKEKITLKFAVSQPTTNAITIETFIPFMDRVTEVTKGQVEFEFYPAEQLGKVADLFELTANGVADIGMYVAAYYPSKMPMTSALLGIPGLYTTVYEGSMTLHELSKQSPLLELDYLSNNVRPIFSYTPSSYEFWSAKKEVKVPKDLKGLKVRTAGGLANTLVSDLGGSAVNIAFNEIYEATERGVIDVISNSATTLKEYGMGEILKFGTDGVSFGGTGSGLVINEKVFQGLPKDVQDALVQVGDEFTESNAKYYDNYAKSSLQEFRDSGIEVYELSEDEKSQWKKFYDGAEASWVQEQNDPDFEKILEDFKEEVKKYK